MMIQTQNWTWKNKSNSEVHLRRFSGWGRGQDHTLNLTHSKWAWRPNVPKLLIWGSWIKLWRLQGVTRKYWSLCQILQKHCASYKEYFIHRNKYINTTRLPHMDCFMPHYSLKLYPKYCKHFLLCLVKKCTRNNDKQQNMRKKTITRLSES